jgi:succinoglycan biosynthesis transport protein ExoP
MAGTSRDLTLRDYWATVRRRKWIVVGGVVAAVAGALGISFAQDPIYETEAQMLVEPRATASVFGQDPTLNAQSLERAIQTEIQVLEGQAVRRRVQEDLGLPSLPPEVRGSAVGSTDVVSVKVRSGDPEVAQRLADAYVDAYASVRREQAVASLEAAGAELQAKIDELQAQIDAVGASQRGPLLTQQAAFKQRLDQLQIDAALTTGGTSVVKSAEEPTEPVEPQPVRTAALAAVLGLLVGLGAAFLLDYLDDSVRVPEDVEPLTDTPVLAVVPVQAPPDHRPVALSEPHEFVVEIYRGLRTNVQFLGLDRTLRTIQITSSLPGEGKTTTATNLAVVLAQAGHRTVLVDADLRKPRAHEVFRVPATPGFTEALLGEPLDLVLAHVDDHLHVVAAGTVPPNPSEMMSHRRVAELLAELAARYDYVIVDTAPILPIADALALSRSVDGVLLVAQANRVAQRELGEALERLDRVGAPLFGLVLNRASSARGDGTYGYGYGYGSRPAETADATPAVPSPRTADSLP